MIDKITQDLIVERAKAAPKHYTELDFRFDAALIMAKNVVLGNGGHIQIIISKAGGVESMTLVREGKDDINEIGLGYGNDGTLKDALRAGFEELLMKL